MRAKPAVAEKVPRGAIVLTPEEVARLERARDCALRSPDPARHENVFVGTAGWTDPSLIAAGTFYPREAKSPEARLRHYASSFGVVEVDATYYALLREESFERWATFTPEGFRFHVKVFPVVTGHPLDVARLPTDLRDEVRALGHTSRVAPDALPTAISDELERRFFESIRPLVRHERLAAVLVQFPPWFEATRGNARKIEAIRERHPELPFSIEFRHGSWLSADRRERVLALLGEHRFSYVAVDEPPEATGLPFLPRVTNPELAVVRLHGRNVAGWTKKGATVAERFRYLYGPEELAEMIDPIRRVAAEAKRVDVIFNNCIRDFAVLGARGLAALLESDVAVRRVSES